MANLYVVLLKRCHSRQLPSMGTVFTTNDRCSCKHVDPVQGAHISCSGTFLSWLIIRAERIARTHSKTDLYLKCLVIDYEEETK